MRLANKLLLIFVPLFFVSSCTAKEVSISGAVSLENGEAIRGGTLLFTELKGRSFSMPDTAVKTVTVTDKNGSYSVTLRDVKGDITISLVRDFCSWRHESRTITFDKVKGYLTDINLVAQIDSCKEK